MINKKASIKGNRRMINMTLLENHLHGVKARHTVEGIVYNSFYQSCKTDQANLW